MEKGRNRIKKTLIQGNIDDLNKKYGKILCYDQSLLLLQPGHLY